MDSDEIVVTSPKLSSTSRDPLTTTWPESNIRGCTTRRSEENRRPLPITPSSRPAGLPPQAKRPRLFTNSSDFILPLSDKDELRSDLEGFGFNKPQIKEMMSRKESSFDPATPGHYAATGKDEEAGKREKRQRVKKTSSGGRYSVGGEKYEPLFLSERSNWALFDPAHGFPPEFGDPPAVMQRFATFAPGNSRVLEYNIDTSSVRTRTTPQLLREGRSVEYTKTGPKIQNAATKRRRGGARISDSSTDTVVHTAPKTKSIQTNSTISRPRGRPRKTSIKVEGSDEGASDGSDSSLTSIELVGEEHDEWIGEEVEVKAKVKKELVEIGDSEAESPTT